MSAVETRTFDLTDASGLKQAVQHAVNDTPITDIHTHLFAPPFGELLLSGIDELLTYHYLVAEFFRVSDMPYDDFWALEKRAQADAIWQALFIERSPISEACRGVLTTLKRLGLDPATRDLDGYRAWFDAQSHATLVDKTFDVANIESVVMTNDPLDPTEHAVWEGGYAGDPRFHAALRIDPLLNDWRHAYELLCAQGCEVDVRLMPDTLEMVRGWLRKWVARMDAKYMAVSLPPSFHYPEDSERATILGECVLPVAQECNIPFAMMIGVTRQVNPQLRLAGDSLGASGVGAVESLCAGHPHNKFMVTMLAREDQHALAVTARKFNNLLPFGCWWFLNNPSLIDEITRMRVELLGTSFIPQHSDARVLEQVIYKWAHSRELIAKVLHQKYADLLAAGWRFTEAEIQRDAAHMLGGNFWDFLARRP